MSAALRFDPNTIRRRLEATNAIRRQLGLIESACIFKYSRGDAPVEVLLRQIEHCDELRRQLEGLLEIAREVSK